MILSPKLGEGMSRSDRGEGQKKSYVCSLISFQDFPRSQAPLGSADSDDRRSQTEFGTSLNSVKELTEEERMVVEGQM